MVSSAREMVGAVRWLALTTLAAILLPLLSCTSGVTAIGAIGAGVATKSVLQSIEDRATHVIQNAAAAGSLVSSKGARDAELLIDAAKQDLHDELDTQWDKLDREKIEMLSKLDEEVSKIEATGKKVTKFEDEVYLDTDNLASRIPFAKKMPHLRHVDGSAQFFKEDGTYDIHVTSDVFAPFGPETKVVIGKDSEPIQIIPDPPYSATIRIPNSKLKFANFENVDFPLTIKTTLEEKSLFSRTKKKEYTFTIPIQLFARYPAFYQMDQVENVPVIDHDSTLVSRGAFLNVPGCGKSGCNTFYNMCTSFPLDAEFVDVVNVQDSFQGWGNFQGQQKVGLGQVCWEFNQHKHDTSRNVAFDVRYHPTKPNEERKPLILKPLVAGKAADALCTPRSAGITPRIEDKVTPAAIGVNDNVCWLQFNTPYFAEFKRGSGRYRLVVHRFDGRNFVAWSGALTESDSAIEIHHLPDNEHAVLIKILEPR